MNQEENKFDQSDELAYFTGVICADGYIAKNSSIVEVKDDNKLFFKKVYIPLVKNLFNITPRLIKENSCKNGFRCYTTSRIVSQFLKMNNIVSPKTFTVKTPNWIIDGKESLRQAFLCGLMDSDGYITVQRNKDIINYPTIGFGSRSLTLANEVQRMMKFLGVNAKFITYNSRGKPMYLVRLFGFEQFEKYMKLIGFKSPKKLRKIEKLLSSGLKRIPHKREKIESYLMIRDAN